MPSDRHPNRWVGEPVYKQGLDSSGREVQIQGFVMSYCPMSTKFLLLYSDGSSEGVPIDEIEDYVPLLRQLPKKERELKKRKAEHRSEERTKRQESSRTSAKRVKVQQTTSTPVAQSTVVPPDLSAVASCFVKDMLWALTTTYNVGDAKQRALLATLDNRSEQPREALARYIEEGGLDVMQRNLCNWACGAGERGDQNEDSNNDVKAEPPSTTGHPVSRHVAAEKVCSSPRPRTRCDQHLRDLMSAAKNMRTEKPENVASAHTEKPGNVASVPAKRPDVVDLTGDTEESDEDETRKARRRLHFGRNSMITYSVYKSVDAFRAQMKRSRRMKHAK